MQTNAVKLISYFDGSKQNLIPLFQRPFSWDKAQWKTLWEDVIAVYESPHQITHFMGAIVSVPFQAVPVGVNRFLIIDGQQRLTALSLLLHALREYVTEQNAGRIDDWLTNRHFNGGVEFLKLLPTQADREFYRAMILNENSPVAGHRMQGCLEYFHRQIRKYRDEEDKKLD